MRDSSSSVDSGKVRLRHRARPASPVSAVAVIPAMHPSSLSAFVVYLRCVVKLPSVKYVPRLLRVTW